MDEKDKKPFFIETYDEIKKLYNIRSKIVHGEKSDTDDKTYKDYLKRSTHYTLKLEEIVRDVLKKLIFRINDPDLNLPKDKNELWQYLNAKGFSG